MKAVRDNIVLKLQVSGVGIKAFKNQQWDVYELRWSIVFKIIDDKFNRVAQIDHLGYTMTETESGMLQIRKVAGAFKVRGLAMWLLWDRESCGNLLKMAEENLTVRGTFNFEYYLKVKSIDFLESTSRIKESWLV